MINEPLIQKRYLQMPLPELQSRQTQLETERLTHGRLSKGKRTYRRRLQQALGMRETEQRAQQARYMNTQARTVNYRLSAQQRYEKGVTQGRSDALGKRPSFENTIEDPEEKRGYHDAYLNVQTQQSRSGWSSVHQW